MRTFKEGDTVRCINANTRNSPIHEPTPESEDDYDYLKQGELYTVQSYHGVDELDAYTDDEFKPVATVRITHQTDRSVKGWDFLASRFELYDEFVEAVKQACNEQI